MCSKLLRRTWNIYVILGSWDIGKTRDGQDFVTVKLGKTRDGHVRDVAVTGPGQIRDRDP